jgi:hypothetical protein
VASGHKNWGTRALFQDFAVLRAGRMAQRKAVVYMACKILIIRAELNMASRACHIRTSDSRHRKQICISESIPTPLTCV